ncbi:MAG: cytidine deaminase [Lachnospiraceae bacterium]|nr:cytidine deaminase [Lachnospiraceae bacterium]
MDRQAEILLQAAKDAMEKAYAPYSSFKVGAAVLTEDGRIFGGCNIENASYGATICAERTAIFNAVSCGYRKIVKIAVVCSSGHYAYPCGICRQVMSEFMDGTSKESLIILEDCEKGILEMNINEMLPYAFSGKDIENG